MVLGVALVTQAKHPLTSSKDTNEELILLSTTGLLLGLPYAVFQINLFKRTIMPLLKTSLFTVFTV